MVQKARNVEKDGQTLIKAIKKNEYGLSITDLVNETNISRSAVRGAISYLKGSKRISERQIGMAKVYSLT